jgi:hypothetical protein
VKVGKLHDTKAMKAFGQACERNARASDFHVEPLVEKAVGRGHKRHGAYRDGSLLEQTATGGRRRLKSYGTMHGRGRVACRNLARFAVNPRCGTSVVYHPENHHQAEAYPRPHKPPPERRFK